MSSSAEKIEGSDDLLTSILLLLPARPLFRFKLVSKRWMSLVSDHHFCYLWKPESFPPALILQSPFLDYPCYYIPDKTESKSSVRFFDFIMNDDPFDDVVILNCCGGLLLCRKGLFDEYIVCNPTTKEFHTLPSPNVGSLDMSLAFDHSISPHYKVINVGIQFSSVWYCLLIEIYSSDTNSWRRSRVQFPESFLSNLGQCKGVFFSGAIFWIFKGVNSFCYFDIDKEIIHSYQLPKMNEQYYCGCVRGNLHLVGSSVSDSHHIDVFVLENDCSSWSLKYCINRREPTSCAIREMICSSPGLTSLELTFSVLSLMTSEGNNQLPYLVLYMPYKAELTVKGRTCEELPLPSVYHLFDNPYWIGGSKLSNVGR
ncbi:F-box protein At5g07610-like [Solanum lycopersicum]|uniref:F-box protein At5g07610-like n=1 Tax=Solanum lycopersicum TaxID=4081 RepID=UPI003748ED75